MFSKSQIRSLSTDVWEEFTESVQNKQDPGRVYISPFQVGCLEPCSYDVRAGGVALMLNQLREDIGKITALDADPTLKARLTKDGVVQQFPNKSLDLEPGEGAILWTEEKIALPTNICALVTTKIALAGYGLVQVTSRIDPGFGLKGGARPLQIPIYNMGARRIRIAHGMKFANLVFLNLQHPAEPYDPGPSPSIQVEQYRSRDLNSFDETQLIAMLSGRDPALDIVAEILRKLVKKGR